MKTIARIAACIVGAIMALESLFLMVAIIVADTWDLRIALALVIFIGVIVIPTAIYYFLLGLGAVWKRVMR